jgi:hypothetical protein
MNNHTGDLKRNAWTNGGAYIVGSVLFLLVSFNIVGAVPKYADGSTDAIAAANFHLYFNYIHDTYWINFGSSLAFLVGALTLLPLGLGLRHLYGTTGYWQTLMSLSFTGGAIFFAVEILMGIGRLHFIATTDWSKAGPATVIGAGITSNMLSQVEGWVGLGFFLSVGAAMVHASRLILADDKLPRRLGQLGLVVAGLYAVGFLVTIVDPLGFLFPYVVLVGGSILAPIWAIWLGVAAGRLEQAGALEVATTPMPTT